MSDDLTTILQRLRALKPELALRFGVSEIHVFGSRARGEEAPDSDLDLLVDFAPGTGPTLFSLAKLDRVLESALGIRVDVVARANLNPRLEPYIRKDMVAA